MLLFFGLASNASALVMWDGHQYELFYTDPINWDDARTQAQSIGSGWDLATVTSQAEHDFLFANLYPTADPNNPVVNYWLGGYQDPTNETVAGDNWKWVTGEPWSYENWATDEPNDYSGAGSEQYLAIDDRWGWKWNDNQFSSGQIAGFVAERVPEPTTLLLLGFGLAGLAGFTRRKFKK
jgi:hypothetical protein